MKPLALAAVVLPLLAGCAAVHGYPDAPVAVTTAPYARQLGFSRIVVPAEARMMAATVDGKPAFCTVAPAYFALGEQRGVCFSDTTHTGVFNRGYVLGTIASSTFRVRIPYVLDAPGTAFRLTPEQMQVRAARLQCAYDAQSATTGERGLIGPAIDSAVLQKQCMRAREAAWEAQASAPSGDTR